MTRWDVDRRRARATLLAAAAGDAVGWPQEPRGGLIGGRDARNERRPKAELDDWVRNGGSRYGRYRDPVSAGSYSDDTQLMLAVARSCLRGDGWAHHLTSAELPTWPIYQRGGGRAVLAAASSWAQRRPPWQLGTDARAHNKLIAYLDAGANGVAMRIAPHVVWAAGNDAEITRRIIQDGVATHGHPRALVGALVYASALHFALTSPPAIEPTDLLHAARRGLVPAEEAEQWLPSVWFEAQPASEFVRSWKRTNDEMTELLETANTSLRQGSISNPADTLNKLGIMGKSGGAGTITAAGALYLAARSGTRPISGLLQAAYQADADTDTLASMTGALLGAIHGDEWLGQLRQVQDADYILDMADHLSHHDEMPSIRDLPSAAAFNRDLDNSHRSENPSGEKFPDGRLVQNLTMGLLSERPLVTRYTLQLDDGQTIIIDRLRRTPPPHSTGLEAIPVLASASTELAAPAASPITSGVAVRVVLVSANLAAIAAFYSDVLGTKITVDDDLVLVAPGLVFQRGTTQPLLGGADAQIGISVADLKAAAVRLQKTVARDSIGSHISDVDPDGRSVIIRSGQ